MTWSEKVMLHINRCVWSAWTHLWCFHCFSWPLSKVILEKLLVTFHDLKWPWRHDEGSPVTIFRLRVSILPVTRCWRVFWMVFVQTRSLSFFSHWLIMERSQNWPDLRSPISKFRDIRFIDTGTDINRWKFQSVTWCSYDENSKFFWGEVTWSDLVTWPWVTWVRNFHKVCGKGVWTAVPKTAALRAAVFQLSSKNLRGGGCSNTPPGPARVKVCLAHQDINHVLNPRTGGGGRVSAPPLRFFEDSEKTAARSGAKFCIAVP